MPERSPESPIGFDGETINISDGMERVNPLPIIDKATLAQLCGGRIPDNISPEILEYLNGGGELRLEQ